MYDRLLFLTIQNKATPVSSSVRLPNLSQTSKTSMGSTNNPLKSGARLERRKMTSTSKGSHEMWDYKMLVTEEVTQLLNLNDQRKDKKRNLFKSSIDFM